MVEYKNNFIFCILRTQWISKLKKTICYALYRYNLDVAIYGQGGVNVEHNKFFSKLTFVLNILCSSSKHHDELQEYKSDE
ncbi:hypothetical protein Lal_00028168 [Lupinus albus]|nr:hypothetical protein Lal_00028168 [Lupinus albus]